MTKLGDIPAFPLEDTVMEPSDPSAPFATARKVVYSGMTLRQYYAGEALSVIDVHSTYKATADYQAHAEQAVRMADALIAELEK